MNKNIKEIYYIAKYHTFKYIEYYGTYYSIVGFRYFRNGKYGYIVNVPSNAAKIGYTFNEIKNCWQSKNEIFLNKNDKEKYNYDWFLCPLNKGCRIVEKKK